MCGGTPRRTPPNSVPTAGAATACSSPSSAPARTQWPWSACWTRCSRSATAQQYQAPEGGQGLPRLCRLVGVRGFRGCAAPRHPRALSPVIPAPPLRHSCVPLPSFRARPPSFLRPPSVIPAQAGTHPRPPPPHPPLPQFIPPPSQGEVRWGVGCCERLPAIVRAPLAHAAPRPPRCHLIHRHSCAPLSSFLCRQEPPLPSTPATLTPEQECRTMPLSPQHRRPALHTVNPSLTNACQNLTEVDTRLTKLGTVNPRPNPKPQQNTAKPQPRPPSRQPRCQPSLSTPPTHPEQP